MRAWNVSTSPFERASLMSGLTLEFIRDYVYRCPANLDIFFGNNSNIIDPIWDRVDCCLNDGFSTNRQYPHLYVVVTVYQLIRRD
ncbi:hypothetical protein SAMN04488067_11177 [Halorubrum xinjiangense]|uniref:Uncharacterized protein n=1 Tax=Halorubrum xinjiangense TaxID=261291 RepID=A0A1G7Q7U1_9EURY|nr:hypothetical protein SAMN04488067_11177 [Halorubrum xinjiangense]